MKNEKIKSRQKEENDKKRKKLIPSVEYLWE